MASILAVTTIAASSALAPSMSNVFASAAVKIAGTGNADPGEETPAPAMEISATAAAPDGSVAGSVLTYTYTVTNSGNVALAQVAVEATTVGAASCPANTLGSGETVTCTASYTLTQADVDAGTVYSEATATGVYGATTVTATTSIEVTLTEEAGITLMKQSVAPETIAVGSVVGYTFTVKNVGNVTLTSVAVSDQLIKSVSCPSSVLAPAEEMACTAGYTLSQANIDAGQLSGEAKVAGSTPSRNWVSAKANDTLVLSVAGAIGLSRSRDEISEAAAAGTIDFGFTVTNTGMLTLTGVTLSDTLTGMVACPDTTLLPGTSMACTASYTLTQADVDAGKVSSTAIVSGSNPDASQVSATSTAETLIPASPSISMVKSAGSPSAAAAGGKIVNTFTVSNTGNVTVANLQVTDTKAGAAACSPATVAPGGTSTCTNTYTITQADVDAGTVTAYGTAVASTPGSGPVTATSGSTATAIPASASLTVEKQLVAAPTEAGIGVNINYRYLVKNTGNVTLSAIAVQDTKAGTISCPATTASPGQQITCTTTYVTTQTDVDTGLLISAPSVLAKTPKGAPVAVDGNSLTTYLNAPLATWGASSLGALGRSAMTSTTVPILVEPAGLLRGSPLLTGTILGKTYKSIAAGTGHTCAITGAPNSYGKVYCWGDNTRGQLGDNTQTSSSVPVAVRDTAFGGAIPTQVTAGGSHTCAIADGKVYCWGDNTNGQLGNNTYTASKVPVAVNTTGVLSGKTVEAISAGGDFTCAVASGLAYCWGGNASGQLGNNSTTAKPVPVAVTASGVLSGKTVTGISSGVSSACVVATGKAYCWGNNTFGRLGNNSTTQSLVPVAVNTSGVLSGKTVTEVSVNTHACAIANGAAYCWGRNLDGQLGNASNTDSSVPVAVSTAGVLSGKTVSGLTLGNPHSCVIAAGKAYCWGNNGSGQLGNNSTADSNIPVAVNTSGTLAGKTVLQMDGGGTYTAAIFQ